MTRKLRSLEPRRDIPALRTACSRQSRSLRGAARLAPRG